MRKNMRKSLVRVRITFFHHFFTNFRHFINFVRDRFVSFFFVFQLSHNKVIQKCIQTPFIILTACANQSINRSHGMWWFKSSGTVQNLLLYRYAMTSLIQASSQRSVQLIISMKRPSISRGLLSFGTSVQGACDAGKGEARSKAGNTAVRHQEHGLNLI